MGHGWGIGWWILDVAVMVAVWGLALWAVVSLAGRPRENDPTQTAEKVLADRLARGEIGTDDYEQRRRSLRPE